MIDLVKDVSWRTLGAFPFIDKQKRFGCVLCHYLPPPPPPPPPFLPLPLAYEEALQHAGVKHDSLKSIQTKIETETRDWDWLCLLNQDYHNQTLETKPIIQGLGPGLKMYRVKHKLLFQIYSYLRRGVDVWVGERRDTGFAVGVGVVIIGSVFRWDYWFFLGSGRLSDFILSLWILTTFF